MNHDRFLTTIQFADIILLSHSTPKILNRCCDVITNTDHFASAHSTGTANVVLWLGLVSLAGSEVTAGSQSLDRHSRPACNADCSFHEICVRL
jgi:hypothetical protein